MNVELKIVPHDADEVELTGIVAQHTNLLEAAKRLGAMRDAECGVLNEDHAACAVKILNGAHLLSSVTRLETEKLSAERRADGERLACQTRIEHAGELVFMPLPPQEKEEKPKTPQEKAVEIKEEFAKLPTKEKFATIAAMEAEAFSATIDFVVKLPSKIGSKILDLMADKGKNIAAEERRANESRYTDVPPAVPEQTPPHD